MNILLRTSFLLISLFLANGAFAQKFLQLEITNSVETKKFGIGETITYKTKEFPDEWQKAKITAIDYETQIIRFEKKMEFVSDITHIKIRKPVPFYLSRMLYVFGGVSAIYGGIGDAVTGELQSQTILYPAISLPLALFLDKVVSVKVYKMGKRANLRILDLRM